MLDLAAWTRGEREPGGKEEKRWFDAPVDSEFAGRWLFKPHREKVLALSEDRAARGEPPDVLVRGEDWAEKIAYELAQILHVPAVVTELATAVRTRDGKRLRGSMSRDMRPPNWQSSPGATLLAERDESFDADTCAGHTIVAIRAVLEGLQGPVGTDYGLWTAFDVFVGYLLLDAWIANTDRHAHNWAVLQSPSGAVCLAPTFDHGSALGSGAGERHHERVLESATGAGGVERRGLRSLAKRPWSISPPMPSRGQASMPEPTGRVDSPRSTARHATMSLNEFRTCRRSPVDS